MFIRAQLSTYGKVDTFPRVPGIILEHLLQKVEKRFSYLGRIADNFCVNFDDSLQTAFIGRLAYFRETLEIFTTH